MDIPKFYIGELFESIQGEGVLTGFKTLFIRTQGCHVGCKFCDTKNSWKQKDKHKYKAYDLFKYIISNFSPNQWICITGGEPLEQYKSMAWLIEKLHKFGFNKISIETAGVPFGEVKDIIDLVDCDVFFSLSPKLYSALGKRFDKEKFSQLMNFWNDNVNIPYRLQYKFVVSCTDDLNILKEFFYSGFVTEHHLFIQVEDSKVKEDSFIEECYAFVNSFPNFRLVIQQHKILRLK